MRVCGGVWVGVRTELCTCMGVSGGCACVRACTDFCACACLSGGVPMCACVCVPSTLCVYVWVHRTLRMCMCLGACAHVDVRAHRTFHMYVSLWRVVCVCAQIFMHVCV